MDILRQTLDIYQKMRKKIPHLLIWIYRARINAEKRYAEKTTQKMDFTGVEIAWVDMKSNEYPLFYIWNWSAEKVEHSGWFWESNTHAYERHPRIFKTSWKILEPDSQGIGPKFWYRQNQRDLLIHFQLFEIKKRSQKKVMAILTPGI